jgi:hypothetical protein
MAQNLDLNINVNTDQAAKSVGSLKSQLREAQAEVAALSDKFGATSKEAIEAAKRAGELKDRIGDAKALTEAFNPDAKFKSLTSSLAGVAGGFAAVQGAMALFGSESEDLQKTLVKVQSAMALSQGLQAVGESIDSFKQLGAVIKTQVIGAFSTLRGAIIATGVGALAIGVGLLIANFEKVKETLTNIFPGLIEFANKIKNIVQGITDLVGVTSKAARAQDNLKSALETSNKAIDNQIKILEAQGGKENEIYEQKKQRINNQIKLIKGSTQEELQARADLNTELKVLEINEANRIKKANEDAAKDRKQAREERDKENQQAREEAEAEEKYLLDLELKYYEKRNEQRKKINAEIIGPDGLTDKERIKKIEDDQKAKEEYAKRMQEFNEESEKNGLGKVLLIQAAANLQSIKDAEETAAAKARIDELEKQSKLANAYAISDIVSGLSNLIGQESAAGKGIAVASATIDTYLSASSLFKNASANPITIVNPAYPYLVAAPAVLSGIARVKQIMAVPIPKGGSGGGSVPSISTQAPMLPQLPAAQTTNISRESINDLGNQAVRAYVIETDVTGNQQRMAAIRQRARFS